MPDVDEEVRERPRTLAYWKFVVLNWTTRVARIAP